MTPRAVDRTICVTSSSDRALARRSAAANSAPHFSETKSSGSAFNPPSHGRRRAADSSQLDFIDRELFPRARRTAALLI